MWALKVASLFSLAVAENETATAGSVSVEILGQSGKMRLFSTAAGQEANRVTVEMDALRELNAAGETIGNTGTLAERHSLNGFANQDFTFDPLESDFRPAGASYNASIHAKANRLTFRSPIGNVGMISVDTLIISHEGLVGPTGGEWFSGVGDMKFNINFPNWKWCGDADSSCARNDVGAFLELDISVKGAADTVTHMGNGVYNLGGDANMTLTDLVTIDGVEGQQMAETPSMRQQGSKTIFTFRFPRFENSAQYDPLIRQGWHWGQIQNAFNNVDGSLISASNSGYPSAMLMSMLMLVGLASSV